MLTLGSLFDGIGGWLLAAVHNGVKPIWSSEIEKFPMAVTKHHFPDVIQLGDITKLDGATLPPVDIICAGSPCQDLSVAGKREGLKGERSGLFINAINIVRRMRMSTGGGNHDSLCGRTYQEHSVAIRDWILEPCLKKSDRPRFQCLLMANGQRTEWHNYLDVRLPGGSSMLNGGSLKGAKESFLSQILQKADDVPKKYYLSPKACIGILRRAKQRGKELPMQLKKALEAQGGGVLNVSIDKTATLRAQEHGHQPIVLDMTHANDVIRESKGKTPTLNARMGTGGNQVPLLMENIPKTIGCDLYNGSISGDQAVGLTAASGASANHSGPAVAYCIAGNMVDRETKQHGLGISKEIASTLTAVDRHAVVYDAYQHHNWRENETVGTLTTHNAGVRGDTPLVMSTTGGQKKAWCVGNGQVHQLYLQEKAGTLNCMSEQQYVMQQVTESKSSEACAPTTEEDSTGRT